MMIEAGENDGFTSFAVDPAGKVLITSAQSQLISTWDLTDGGKKIRSWRGHPLPVLSMEVDPSGTLVATGSADRTVRVWDISKGHITHRFTGHSGVVGLVYFRPVYTASKMELITCSDGGEIKVYELYSRRTQTLTEHMSTATGIAFSPDGSRMFSAGRDSVINVWTTERNDYKLVKTMPVYESLEGIVSLPASTVFPDASVDERYLATAGEHGKIVVWEQNNLRKVFTVNISAGSSAEVNQNDGEKDEKEGKAATQVLQLFLAEKMEGGGFIISTTHEHNIHFNSLLGLEQTRVVVGHNDEVLDIVWAPLQKVKKISQGSNGENGSVNETGNKTDAKSQDESNDANENGAVEGTHAESQAVFVATNSSAIRLYDAKTLNSRLLMGHSETVLSLAITPDGKYLLSGSKDTTVRVWELCQPTVRINEDNIHLKGQCRELQPPRCVAVFKGHTKAISSICACRRATSSFFISCSRDTTMKLWDFSPLRKRQKKAKRVSSGEDSKLAPKLFRKAQNGVVSHEKDVNCVAVSLDDRIIATGSSDRTVKLWSAPDLSYLATLKGHKRGVWTVAFSDVDKVVCSGSGDQTIKIWSVESDFQCLRTFQGHEASVTQVSFINAGTQLLSCSSDAVMKLWTVKSNECIWTLADVHDDKIWALKSSRDGRSVVTGGEDSKIVFWVDATTEEDEKERAIYEAKVLKEQELRNNLRAKNWVKAIRIALELTHSRQLYKIFTHLYQHAQTDEIVVEALAECSPEERAKIILWIREWNTHTERMPVAHYVLARMLRNHRILDGLDSTSRQDLRNAMRHIINYSNRHFKRLDTLLQKTYLFDHMLATTSLVGIAAGEIQGMGGLNLPGKDDIEEDGISFDADEEEDDVEPELEESEDAEIDPDKLLKRVDPRKLLQGADDAGVEVYDATGFEMAWEDDEGNEEVKDDDKDDVKANHRIETEESESRFSTPKDRKSKKKQRGREPSKSASGQIRRSKRKAKELESSKPNSSKKSDRKSGGSRQTRSSTKRRSPRIAKKN
eukprot:CAMPEP_0114494404 /NCGR_PEP_ID=MMETSP0109-20121206/4633_1 /TAXON_ID=29199 /ORGANISM="Chlorarachnion reptans, Strain CCCM449" /LENGTH=1022 /DNA_ID=CAMNT_0001671437 /DNA_START=96 /DNA_END=3164 /DNA_ORIENTATION=-